jgi:hypothetical protein
VTSCMGVCGVWVAGASLRALLQLSCGARELMCVCQFVYVFVCVIVAYTCIEERALTSYVYACIEVYLKSVSHLIRVCTCM